MLGSEKSFLLSLAFSRLATVSMAAGAGAGVELAAGAEAAEAGAGLETAGGAAAPTSFLESQPTLARAIAATAQTKVTCLKGLDCIALLLTAIIKTPQKG